MQIQSRANAWFERIEQFELPLCAYFNRANDHKTINRFFKMISRLGDGVFWYCLIAVTVLYFGQAAIIPAVQILLTGVIGVLLYKYLKQRLVRERPFISHATINCNTKALDRYSFPSGHTLHAVNFSTLLIFYYPSLIWVVVPFAVLVALSRFVLGLHYISDVLVGAFIGVLLALLSIQVSMLSIF